MKYFVFMYPHERYINSYFYRGTFHLLPPAVRHLNALIDARYRKSGYRVAWLLHSKETNGADPDFDGVYQGIKIDPVDLVIVSGITSKQMRNAEYPKPGYILGQLTDIEELRVGGFHLHDCVDRFAGFAHHAGVKTLVDEGCTEHFFLSVVIHKEPEEAPLVSEVSEWPDHIRTGLRRLSRGDEQQYGFLLENIRDQRKNRPWLVGV